MVTWISARTYKNLNVVGCRYGQLVIAWPSDAISLSRLRNYQSGRLLIHCRPSSSQRSESKWLSSICWQSPLAKKMKVRQNFGGIWPTLYWNSNADTPLSVEATRRLGLQYPSSVFGTFLHDRSAVKLNLFFWKKILFCIPEQSAKIKRKPTRSLNKLLQQSPSLVLNFMGKYQ